MKLLFFIYSLSCGGAERATVNLADHWVAKGWEISIVTLAQRSLDFYDLHPAVRRIALGLAGNSSNSIVGFFQNLRRVRALRQVLRKVQPDVALALMSSSNMILALSANGLQTIRTIGSERIHPPQFPLGIIWERLRYHIYSELDAVTALTLESADWLRKHTSVRRVRVIPNAVSWPLTDMVPCLNSELICKDGRKVLLAVGRLVKQKGFDRLIDVFAELAKKHPKWDLVILGEGPERAKLEAQLQANGLTGRVFLPGLVGNMGEWYERSNLYVMSSYFEGLPNTLLEAMAHGMPVVSFDCDTGPRDIIRHEIDGLLVPPGDVAALSSALDHLMDDKETCQRFGARAVEVRERFSIEKIARMWEELFEDIQYKRLILKRGLAR
jgi:glycosyltransferase involved in cell wall biosynthesis